VREVKTMNVYKPIGVITALALDTDLKDKSGNVISKGLRGTFTVGLRNYIAEGTQRGPDSGLLLTPRIFTFTHSPP
jgi:hypothetical protein